MSETVTTTSMGLDGLWLGWGGDEEQTPMSWAARGSRSGILKEEEEVYADALRGRLWRGLADEGYLECHENLRENIIALNSFLKSKYRYDLEH